MTGKLGALVCFAMFCACYNPYPDNPITGGAGAGPAGGAGAGPAGGSTAGGAGGVPGFCESRPDVLFCADFDVGPVEQGWTSWAATAPPDAVSLAQIPSGPNGSAPFAARTELVSTGGDGGGGGAADPHLDVKLLKEFDGSISAFHLELDVLGTSSFHFAGVIRKDTLNKACVLLLRVDDDKLILNFNSSSAGAVDARTETLPVVPGAWAEVAVDVDFAAVEPSFDVEWNGVAHTATIEGAAELAAWADWSEACADAGTANNFRLELGPHYALAPTEFAFDDVVFDKIR